MKNTVRKQQPATPSTPQLSRGQQGASHWVAGDSRLLTWELDPILGQGALFFSPWLADLTGHLLEEEEGPGGGGERKLPCNHGNGSIALWPIQLPLLFLLGNQYFTYFSFPVSEKRNVVKKDKASFCLHFSPVEKVIAM